MPELVSSSICFSLLIKNFKSAGVDTSTGEKISDGVVLEDGVAQVDSVAYDGDGNDKRKIGVEIHSGRNRVVRRIFEHLQYDVRKLDRVYFAGLTKKDLPCGRWRFLTEMELNMLRMQTGDKKHRKAEAE